MVAFVQATEAVLSKIVIVNAQLNIDATILSRHNALKVNILWIIKTYLRFIPKNYICIYMENEFEVNKFKFE